MFTCLDYNTAFNVDIIAVGADGQTLAKPGHDDGESETLSEASEVTNDVTTGYNQGLQQTSRKRNHDEVSRVLKTKTAPICYCRGSVIHIFPSFRKPSGHGHDTTEINKSFDYQMSSLIMRRSSSMCNLF